MKKKINSGNSSKIIKRWAVTLAKAMVTALFWLILWQIASYYVSSEILLPSPLATFTHLLNQLSSLDFLKACANSIFRIMAGFLVGCLVGLILAVLCHALPFCKMLFTPFKATVKATPVASFIIIAYMWLSKSDIPGFIASLIVIPIIWSNVSAGLENTDKNLLEVAKVFSFSPLYYIKHVYYPAVKPFFTAGAITGIGLAWKSGIAAEVLVVVRDGIGGLLYDSKIYFESADLFAITAVIIVISLIIEKGFEKFMKKGAGK